MIAAN
jgi:hypothetical protein